MILPFNEIKAAQCAAALLRLVPSGRMSYVKLVRLMYLVDRRALIDWGHPVTTDQYVCTNNGPILSRVNALITEGSLAPSDWSRYVSTPQGRGDDLEVELLLHDVPSGELSKAEHCLIEKVFAEHSDENKWQLIEFTKALPEWVDPKGSAIVLEYRDILRIGGKTEAEVAAIIEELEAHAFAVSFLEPFSSGAML